MIVPGMSVCSNFLISGCLFIVLRVLLISGATVIVRAGGVIRLNPFVTVLFNVCSAVLRGCVWYEPFQHSFPLIYINICILIHYHHQQIASWLLSQLWID